MGKTAFKSFLCIMKITSFILLTEVGGRGDTVFVKKSVGRNKLLPQGLAVYPSLENKQMFAEELRVCIAFKHCHLCRLYVSDSDV